MATGNPSFANSVINLGVTSSPPDILTDPQSKLLYVMFSQMVTNLQQALEQYVGITQKAVTQWPTLQPTDTILRQNAGRLYGIFTENVSFGAFVNLFNNAGVLGIRNSNSVGKPAHGYCNVSGGVLGGAYGEAILSQGIMAITGVNPGNPVYLSTSAGQVSLTPDTTAGHIEQFIGIGVATNLVYVDISLGQYIQH